MRQDKFKCSQLVILGLTLISSISVNGVPEAGIGKSANNGKDTTYNKRQYPQYTTNIGSETSFGTRDTYVNAANEFGYNVGNVGSSSSASTFSKDPYTSGSSNVESYQPDAFGNPTAWYYQITPNHNPWTSYNSNPSYTSNDLYDVDEEGSSGGWLCRMFWGDSCDSTKRQEPGERQGAIPVDSIAALGIFGVIGLILKKIGFIKILPWLPILPIALPIILPILLVVFLPLLLAAFFLPIVPVIVIGRSLARSSPAWARSAKDALLSEDCVERITCEASRFARGYGYEAKWIDGYLKNSSKKSKWAEKLVKARNADCKSYTCGPITSMKKAFKLKEE